MATSIHQEVTVKATPARIYRAFMSSKEHAAFTANSKAKISRKEGGAFSAHDGYVTGRNIELKPDRRIVQAWRVKGMPESVYSIVRFELKRCAAVHGWFSTRLACRRSTSAIFPKAGRHATGHRLRRIWKRNSPRGAEHSVALNSRNSLCYPPALRQGCNGLLSCGRFKGRLNNGSLFRDR
jgi:uncharacterized protein YndB with AHSA1/START domain